VLRTYDQAPLDEHIICVDEKLECQALERKRPDIVMQPGQPVRKRVRVRPPWDALPHGRLRRAPSKALRLRIRGPRHVNLRCLVGSRRRFLSRGAGHLVCDNLSAHDTDDVLDWLIDHPRWTLHFTPKHASWLNQIECAFSILASTSSPEAPSARSMNCGSASTTTCSGSNLQDDPPFHWTYTPKSWSQIPGKDFRRAALVDPPGRVRPDRHGADLRPGGE